jgi:hypothetical protein
MLLLIGCGKKGGQSSPPPEQSEVTAQENESQNTGSSCTISDSFYGTWEGSGNANEFVITSDCKMNSNHCGSTGTLSKSFFNFGFYQRVNIAMEGSNGATDCIANGSKSCDYQFTNGGGTLRLNCDGTWKDYIKR